MLALVLAGACAFLVYYKTSILRLPVLPELARDTWIIESKIVFEAQGRSVKVRVQAPERGGRWDIQTENFVSEGFSLAAITVDGRREIVWSRRPSPGKYRLYYQALVHVTSDKDLIPDLGLRQKAPKALTGERAEALARFIASTPKKLQGPRERLRWLLQRLLSPEHEGAGELLASEDVGTSRHIVLARRIVSELGLESRVVHGVQLKHAARDVPTVTWLEIHSGGKWRSFDLIDGKWGPPEDSFAWWRGDVDLLQVDGVQKFESIISVTPSEGGAKRLRVPEDSDLAWLTFGKLPAESQAVYRLILLLPLGALVVAFIRSIVGIRTFGTFMPVLIALAFRDTGLIAGILLFSGVVGLGLFARWVFERLKLLIVPRLAATLTLVILIVVGLSVFLDAKGFDVGVSIALFPMVIMTMTIERMSIMWEEIGGIRAVRQGVVSLAVSAIAYLSMFNSYSEYLFFSFPELTLLVLALLILMGRYTGYRLVELYRFRTFAERIPKV